MTSRPLFDEDGWLGGFYELAMELGRRSDERLRAAGEALWSHPALEGLYGERDVPPDRQQPPDPPYGILWPVGGELEWHPLTDGPTTSRD